VQFGRYLLGVRSPKHWCVAMCNRRGLKRIATEFGNAPGIRSDSLRHTLGLLKRHAGRVLAQESHFWGIRFAAVIFAFGESPCPPIRLPTAGLSRSKSGDRSYQFGRPESIRRFGRGGSYLSFARLHNDKLAACVRPKASCLSAAHVAAKKGVADAIGKMFL